MAERNNAFTPSRRSTLAALALSALMPCGARAGLTTESSAHCLAACTGSDRKAAQRIGRAYLADHPAEAHTDHLTRVLEARLDMETEAVTHLAPSRLRVLLDEAIRADFAGFDTVMLDGWVLSRTEVRLCALAALGR